MSYRNKTYVAFASEDIHCYRMMEAWRDNDHIDFDFFDAHDLFVARDTSKPDSIRARLRQRLDNAKQVVVLVSEETKPKAGRENSFLYYEMEAIARLNLPVVFANLNGSQKVQTPKLPSALSSGYTMSVSFRPTIIKYALDHYVLDFGVNEARATPKIGPYHYKDSVYDELGLS